MSFAKIKTQLGEAVATAVAAAVAFWVASLLTLPQPYWAAISALIVIQANLQKTLTASRDRLVGTFIGAVMGGAFAAYVGTKLWMFAVAVFVTVLICTLLRLPGSYRLATVTVAIVMLVKSAGWGLAFDRFAEVSIGIVVAIVLRAGLNAIRRASGALPLPHLDREHDEMQE